MELQEIRYFLAVCKTRNFTRAAELCNVTQPALTRAIQKIEEEIGGQLLARERGNTHLTGLGRLLEPQLAEIMRRAGAARTAATRFVRLEAAEVRLGVMDTIGPLRFIAFLRRFASAHSGITLTVVEGTAARLSDQFIGGEIDAAVMANAESLPVVLRAVPLYEERFVVACAHDHAFAQRSGIRIADLRGEAYLRRTDREFCGNAAEGLGLDDGEPACPYHSDREDWLQAMVAAGNGVCVLPEFSMVLPGLVTRPVLDTAAVRRVCCVSVAGRRWSSPVAALIEAMRAHRWHANGVDAQAAAATPDHATALVA